MSRRKLLSSLLPSLLASSSASSSLETVSADVDVSLFLHSLNSSPSSALISMHAQPSTSGLAASFVQLFFLGLDELAEDFLGFRMLLLCVLASFVSNTSFALIVMHREL